MESRLTIAVGFFDESTDEDLEGISYTVAGFCSHNKISAQMELRWRDLLNHYNLEYFKASELNAGQGQFRQFRDDPSCTEWRRFSDREKTVFAEIKTAFTDVIAQSADSIYGVGAVVILPDYERLLAESSAARKVLRYPYYIAAQWVLIEAGLNVTKQNKSHSPGDKVWIRPVFDSNETYSGRMKQVFDSFCADNPLAAAPMLPPYYEDDKQYLSLQVADNLAFEIRKYVECIMTHRKQRKALERIAGCFFHVYNLNYSSLKAIVDASGLPVRENYTLDEILE